MVTIDGLIKRPLTAGDIPGGLALSQEAGWNQTMDDWRLMLAHGQGFGVESNQGQLIATALTMPHGNRLAWISMVLVTPSWRKQGLATHLLQTCIDSLHNRSMLPLLDATEAGKIVYGKVGFKTIYGLRRMICRGPAIISQNPEYNIREFTRSELASILEMDRRIFGADRSTVIKSLWQRQPGHARIVTGSSGKILGYIMMRDGDHADHIGPIVAADEPTAQALTTSLLNDIGGPVYIDAMDQHSGFQEWLTSIGFETQRTFTRMVLGELDEFDQPGQIYAAVGPELG